MTHWTVKEYADGQSDCVVEIFVVLFGMSEYGI